ncbi:MAG: DUF5666 domain-containing protein [Microbacteriaceae bacterium]|nr:DUF5666 domain-containing protein [Microbacteriaceae bacterium]MCL2796263.1 DUF5666 domain-containing protein [Microbacteriaceae bacterium]
MKTSTFTLATGVAALVVGAALVLTGCSGSGAANASSKSSSTPQSQGQSRQGGGFGGGAGFGGGTVGQIAAVSGSTLQVQSSTDQTAVTFTSSTAITTTVDVALSAVKVGECVTATTVPASGSTSSSSSSTAPVTSVAISQPVSGSCSRGFGGTNGGGTFRGQGGTGSGQRPSGFPTSRPRPSGSASGRGFGGGNFVLPTSGEVTAVSGSTITVDALDFQTQKTAPKTVTVDASTKYTETEKATSTALAVGQCVVAQGKADDTGAVTATAIAVSAPVNGSCTTGFGFRGQRGGTGGTGGTGTSGGANGAEASQSGSLNG